MTAYDFSDASYFLSEEAGLTPRQLYDDVIDAMNEVSLLGNDNNRSSTLSVWSTLLTCAGFLERITPRHSQT